MSRFAEKSAGLAFIVIALAALAGCTLSQDSAPRVITATPALLLATATAAPSEAASPVASPTASPTSTPTEAASPTPSEPTTTPLPIDTSTPELSPTPFLLPPTLAPTRTPSIPPTVPPLDDGSGRAIAGTGRDLFAMTGLEDIDALPETLYYLGGDAGAPQVWRLQWGLTAPQQLSYTPWGVAAYSVAPDGTLAYVANNGEMTIGGLPVIPPAGPDGVRLTFQALAWSPLGGWLAYVLQTPGIEPGAGGDFPLDGVWLRGTDGRSVHVARSSASGTDTVIYTGPLHWRPDGTEILVGARTATGFAAVRINISAGEIIPVWNEAALLPGSYDDARWSADGSAIIAAGGGQVLRIEPDTLETQVLVEPDAALQPRLAQQLPNGILTFTAQPAGAAETWRLYVSAPGQANPVPVTEPLADEGRLEYLWDSRGEEAILVAYASPDAPYGTPYYLDATGALRDLSPVLGEIAAPSWGPVVIRTDTALIVTGDEQPLNMHAAPGGAAFATLPNGTLVTVLGGPRVVEGLRWWQVRTASGDSGWVTEAVTDARGRRVRTLIPLP